LTFSNNGGTAVTNSNGFYSRGVSYGWSGTVTPAKTGYVFDPVNRSYSDITSDRTGQGYTATAVTPVISGRVTDTGGTGIAGAALVFSTNGETIYTNTDGNYTHALPYGWSGTVTPVLAGYTFDPASRSYTEITGDHSGEDYTAYAVTPFISGKVTLADGSGMPEVTLFFSNNGGTAVTDAGGNYAHALPYGWSGTVTPTHEGYSFDPANRTYANLTSDTGDQDYTAVPITPLISGHVTDSGGTGIPGVTLDFPGAGSTVTDANGYYSHAVPYNWSGDVSPVKEGFTFSPGQRSYGGVTHNRSGEDYTAQAITPVISGRISDENGASVFEVTLEFSNGGGTATTDANGNYVQAVPYGWSGTVTPAKTGFTFEPGIRTYSDVITDQTGRNYMAAAVTPLISGRIADSNGTGIFQTTLTFSNDGGTVTTDVNGSYLHPVPFGWSGTVTPSKAGYIFEPVSREYDDVITAQPSQDYTGTAVTPVISGRVFSSGGSGIPGVTLLFAPGGGSTVTDAAGNYSMAVEYGWSGRVIPEAAGFNFSPTHRVYTDVTVDMAGQDYTAVPNVVLQLQVSRETERAWILSRHYGKITLTIENTGNAAVDRCVIYRKAADENYQTMENVPLSGAPVETFTYDDTFLEKDIVYTYKAVAYDENDTIIGTSEEVSI
jgi:hypothetical protein